MLDLLTTEWEILSFSIVLALLYLLGLIVPLLGAALVAEGKKLPIMGFAASQCDTPAPEGTRCNQSCA